MRVVAFDEATPKEFLEMAVDDRLVSFHGPGELGQGLLAVDEAFEQPDSGLRRE